MVITDTGYTIALSLRQVQTFGLSSRTFTGQTTANYGYGAHFEAAKPISYTTFADVNKSTYSVPSYCPVGTAGSPDAKPGNCRFDTSAETLQNYKIGRGLKVAALCGRDTGGVLRCSTDQTNPITSIDIVFLRPNTDTVVTASRSGAGDIQLKDLSITLSTPDNAAQRLVCVSYAGQISVTPTACP